MIFDLHNDAITKLGRGRFLRYVKKAGKQGLSAMLVSVWTTKLRDPLGAVKRAREIIDGAGTGVRLLLHIEDAGFVDLGNIDAVLACRPFSVGLTWNFDNGLAGGAKGSGQVTDLGREVIGRFRSAGVKIDLAHLNRQSFFEVAEILRGEKLLCTHTCFDAVTPHLRNLTRAQVELIVESGGVVGLTFERSFSRGDVLAHYRWFLENFGAGNLCIGTDFYGADIPRGFNSYKKIGKIFPPSVLCENAKRGIL
jgi:microsomal dipeptidase-like Zn-dependent dipeptidase